MFGDASGSGSGSAEIIDVMVLSLPCSSASPFFTFIFRFFSLVRSRLRRDFILHI